jgi:hypothetical protein
VTDNVARAPVEAARGEAIRRLGQVTAAAALGAALLAPRIAAIRQSLWHDEIYTIQHYISGGPARIFGHYSTNDHMLFSLLSWLTVGLPGGSDSLYRIWAIVPFVVAVMGVAAWLQRRAGMVEASVFAVLAATSSMLLQLTSEARGYGLGFLAAGLLLVAGYEAAVTRSRRWVDVFCAACVLGTWTLPTFVLPAAGAAVALLFAAPALRRVVVARLVVAAVAIGAWYAPTLSALVHSTGQQFGAPLPWDAPFTGGFTLFADAYMPRLAHTGGSRLVLAAVVAPLIIAGLREARRHLPLLLAPTLVPVSMTLLTLTLSRMWVSDRFLSFLLLPIFVTAALGAAALLRRPSIGFVYAGVILVLVSVSFLRAAQDTARLPYEDNRGAARAIAAAAAAGVEVIANSHVPDDLRYYLPPSVRLRVIPPRSIEAAICSPHAHGLVFVQEPYLIKTVATDCLRRRGATLRQFLQRGRGGSISVWVAAAAAT